MEPEKERRKRLEREEKKRVAINSLCSKPIKLIAKMMLLFYYELICFFY